MRASSRTNDDATYPTPDGPIPGGGAILAGIATASGRQPVVAGKPYAPMADAVRGLVGARPAGQLLVVGDRASTDGEFAVTLGCPFALVRSGVTRPGDDVGVPVALDVADLAAVVDLLPPAETPVSIARWGASRGSSASRRATSAKQRCRGPSSRPSS